jgi:hypothetical protein
MIRAGHVIRETVFCADECERLIASIAGHSTTSGRAGVRNLMQCEPVRQVAEGARLKEIIRRVSSGNFSAYKATFGVLTADEIDSLVSEIPSEECLVPKGGVLLMSPLLVHASSKGVSNEPRRVLHTEYAASRDLAKGIRLGIARVRKHQKSLRSKRP